MESSPGISKSLTMEVAPKKFASSCFGESLCGARLYGALGRMCFFLGTAVCAAVAVPSAGQSLTNGSFENPQIPSTTVYSTTAPPWAFTGVTGVAGITANGSPFTSQSPPTTDGRQVAVLQGESYAKQTVTFSTPMLCSLSFIAEQRRENADSVGIHLQLELDSVVFWSGVPVRTGFTSYTTPQFFVAAGSRIIGFHSLNPAGNDNSVFIDSATLTCATPPTFSNKGFEAPELFGSYQYNPPGATWTFFGSGITGNNNAFTGGNPVAPQGVQVAFLPTNSYIKQTPSISAGTYSLSFQAAQRGNYQFGNQVIGVYVDGIMVGQYSPQSTIYATYQTSPFTVTATGYHEIKFLGMGNGGSDYTAFIDNVQLTLVSQFYGFWDQGFISPKVRTNYTNSLAGTLSSPITLTNPCPLFAIGVAFNGCFSIENPLTKYSASNAYSLNLPAFTTPQFWVLINNNDQVNPPGGGHATPTVTCNTGPPDNSLARSSPGSGIFGYASIKDTTAGEQFYRHHLSLNFSAASNPCNSATGGAGGSALQAISYMSIGAHTNRGNSNLSASSYNIGALNPTAGVPSKAAFNARLYSQIAPVFYGVAGSSAFRLTVVASWPRLGDGIVTPRMIQLSFYHKNDTESCSVNCTVTPFGPSGFKWNWPIVQDTFYAGAEGVAIDAEDVQAICGFSVRQITDAPGDLNKEIPYDIDLQALYKCFAATQAPPLTTWVGTSQGFSNPMGTGANIPITVVDWAVEGFGTSGGLWFAVNNMAMH